MPDSERIAQLRPSYQEELARGTGRFFLPARTDCPWCLGTDLRRKFRTTDLIQGKPGEFVLDQCRGCGHVFQNPKLSQEGLDFYYRDFYDGLGAETTAKMFEGNGSKKRFRRSARALRRLALPGRWLDVGTSLGHFCATAKEVLPHTEFDGLDMGEGVEQAAKEGRIQEAYRGLFVDLADEMAGRYDAVSMFHYLEHTLDPHRELAAAHKALAPGGHLLIEVPDPESWSGRLLGRLWLPWFQPQHLTWSRWAICAGGCANSASPSKWPSAATPTYRPTWRAPPGSCSTGCCRATTHPGGPTARAAPPEPLGSRWCGRPCRC